MSSSPAPATHPPTTAIRLDPLADTADGAPAPEKVLVPIAEPLSAGFPPTAPVVTRGVAERDVRRGRTASGQPHATPIHSGRRALFDAAWPALSGTQTDALRAFFRNDTRGRELGFTVRPDAGGPGGATASGRALTLRAVSDPVFTLVDAGGGRVWRVECRCEHVG